MSLANSLGWLGEPEPTAQRRRLGWVSPRSVSRETASEEAVSATAHRDIETRAEPVDKTQAVPAGEQESMAAQSVDKTVDRVVDRAVDGDLGTVSTTVGEHGPGQMSRPQPGRPVPSSSDAPAHHDQVVDPTAAPTPTGPAAEQVLTTAPVATTDSATTDSATTDFASTDPATTSAAGDASITGRGGAVAADSVNDRAEHADAIDRAALAETIPSPGDDTPLGRDLADTTRRRIRLTGRVFPKPVKPRVLTVANQKGGVGKTTTTVNIAAAMAQSGLTVLVVDLDPQGNASTALGIDHHADVPSVYDVLVEGRSLLEVVQPCASVDGLFCAPATIDLAGAEIELVSLVARESRLNRALMLAAAEGHPFDYILIDCPPSLGLLTVNAMVASSEIFIPIQCEYYALEGLSQLLKNIELIKSHLNPLLHVSTILLTMYDGRTRLSAQVAQDVRDHFPTEVLTASVPRSVRVSEAPSFGETVMTYDPSSSGALAYLEAAGEIADRGAST